VLLSQCNIFGAVDPSLGVTGGDYSAILALARAPTGQLFLVLDDEKRRSPYNIIRDVQGHHQRLNFTRVGIETVQFQALFATDAARESMKSGLYINFVQVPQGNRNKYLRIQGLEPAVTTGYILVPEHGAEELKRQAASWPMGSHDDGLDCLEICYRITTSWSAEGHAQIVEGKSMLAGDGMLLAPSIEKDWDVAEQLAHEADVARAIEEEREPPKELWQPMMRYF
jgi:predicted phage terminase large subunit-like protein